MWHWACSQDVLFPLVTLICNSFEQVHTYTAVTSSICRYCFAWRNAVGLFVCLCDLAAATTCLVTQFGYTTTALVYTVLAAGLLSVPGTADFLV